MIRFRIAHTTPEEASYLRGPLARLAGLGPWSIRSDGHYAILTRGDSAAWTAWRAGVYGLEYALSDPMPPLDPSMVRKLPQATIVALQCGIGIPVQPAAVDGYAINLITGEIGESTSSYGQAVADAVDAMTLDGQIAYTDERLRAVMCEVLTRAINLPIEAIAAYGIVSTADMLPILEAAAGLPKVLCDAGSSPAEVPA